MLKSPRTLAFITVWPVTTLLFNLRPTHSATFDLVETSVPKVQLAIDKGLITSESLVQQYLDRIAAYDDQGPAINSIIQLNPKALETARSLDTERVLSGKRGPLHGVPMLLKDNIDTFDLPTTAGALVLEGSVPPDDAFITQRLRDAGAVILGKANLTEFANFVAFDMPNGFSAVGGQTLNRSTGSPASILFDLAGDESQVSVSEQS